MSCRSTGAGSHFTSWARFSNGRVISEQATLSAFHQLRNAYLSRPEAERHVYTDDEYRSLLGRQRARVESSPTLTDAERRRLLDRLDRAEREPMPDQATTYAVFNAVPAVRNRGASLNQWLQDMSERTGTPVQTLRERFDELTAGRTNRNTPDATREAEERVAGMGMARDAGTVHAVIRMESEARHLEALRARTLPQRFTEEDWQTVTNGQQETSIPGVTVERWAYDPRNGRLEVVVRDSAAGDLTTHTYRGVDSTVIDAFHAHAGLGWYNRVRGNSMYQYANEDDAALDGVAPNCPNCGQFANASHSCPPVRQVTRWRRYMDNTRWTDQNAPMVSVNENGDVIQGSMSFRLPPIRRLQQSAAQGVAEIELESYHRATIIGSDGRSRWNNQRIGGTVRAWRNEDRTYTVEPAENLQCTCPDYRDTYSCVHVDAALRAVRYRLERPSETEIAADRDALRANAVVAAADRVQRAAENALASDWTRNETTAAEAAATWRRESDVLYSENPDAFMEDFEAAQAARAAKNGVPDIPYMRENALDGLCQRGSGKAFGVEIEYQFDPNMPYSDRMEAQRRIGQELYAAGLTYSPDQQPYRASGRRGFRDTHTDENGVGNWSWEHDGSVDGELVTPGMYDEPETWQKLEIALDILRRNGAVGGLKAGAHVHVGTGEYSADGTSAAEYAELGRMVTQHEDVLVRLASNPHRGTHRNNGYSKPLPAVPPSGFSSVSDARNWQDRSAGRYATLNLMNCSGTQTDHPEFRVFDASLDPGTVQAQVKLAVAMTAAASRNAAAGGTTRGKEEWGAHKRRSVLLANAGMDDPNASLSDRDRTLSDAATARSLLDTLFRRREDKAQLVAVFANTEWADPPSD